MVEITPECIEAYWKTYLAATSGLRCSDRAALPRTAQLHSCARRVDTGLHRTRQCGMQMTDRHHPAMFASEHSLGGGRPPGISSIANCP